MTQLMGQSLDDLEHVVIADFIISSIFKYIASSIPIIYYEYWIYSWTGHVPHVYMSTCLNVWCYKNVRKGTTVSHQYLPLI